MSQKIKTDKQFGSNLRRLRKQNHMTQEQVAAKLQVLGFDMSRSMYAQIECGTYNIRVTELVALKQIFSTTYDSFFEGVEAQAATNAMRLEASEAPKMMLDEINAEIHAARTERKLER